MERDKTFQLKQNIFRLYPRKPICCLQRHNLNVSKFESIYYATTKYSSSIGREKTLVMDTRDKDEYFVDEGNTLS